MLDNVVIADEDGENAVVPHRLVKRRELLDSNECGCQGAEVQASCDTRRNLAARQGPCGVIDFVTVFVVKVVRNEGADPYEKEWHRALCALLNLAGPSPKR